VEGFSSVGFGLFSPALDSQQSTQAVPLVGINLGSGASSTKFVEILLLRKLLDFAPHSYAGRVSQLNEVPSSVRQRAALLERLLSRLDARAPKQRHASMERLENALSAQDESVCLEILSSLNQQGLLDHARESIQCVPMGALQTHLQERMRAWAAASRQLRAANWQRDAHHHRVAVNFEKTAAIEILMSPDVQTLLLSALQAEGLLVAFDLGKRPKPLIRVAPTLPSGVIGISEWAEFTLQGPVRVSSDELLTRLNARLPEGPRLLRWVELSDHASPMHELCRVAHWRWPCPDEMHDKAVRGVSAFSTSTTFPLEKVGKQSGQKQEKIIDLKEVIQKIALEENTICFSTRLGLFESLNPRKVLAAILECDLEDLHGLVRKGFDISDDPRLKQADKFETKLKNIYEDATLLSTSGNITLIDEDDEPLLLH
jgi:radical SAM-linked protein